MRSENCRDDVSFASRPSSASRSRDESRSTSSSLASAWLRDDARSSFRRRRTSSAKSAWSRAACSDLCGNHRVVLHAIDATPARWRGDAGSSPLDQARTAASSPGNDLVKNCRVHPTHWLISTQTATRIGASSTPANSKSRTACARGGRVDDGLVNDERKHYIHLDAIDAQLLSVCLPMSSSIIHAIDA